HILQILRDEKKAGISGGLYHELQVRMTYNSNHIEGSKLSEDQTRMIFETKTIGACDGVSVDDIIETSNHFRCIDYAIDVALEPLSEDIVKHFHLLLKRGTSDSDLDWFNVGGYKLRANVVGGKETCKPSEVPGMMKKLIADYLAKPTITIEDIVAFHADFESIHPFQDGNGRVGRLIALKECLRWNITPFIIEDAKKYFYYRGLSNWKQDTMWLIDTCLDGQDTFKFLLKMLDIPI
ncbi:MAG: Fic family protein, partial [Clostridiales bacterium]|nr:Fic family protein [Clostridiales bacterium]